MPRKSLIIAIVGMALVSVPAALGKSQPVTHSPDAIERAVLARELSSRLDSTVYRDAFERAVAADRTRTAAQALTARSQALNERYGLGGVVSRDAFERAALANANRQWLDGLSTRSEAMRSSPGLGSTVPVSDSHDRFSPAPEPVSIPAVGSGREIDWPQIGVGFGVGLVLAMGLMLTMRYTRIRPLAH